MEHGSVKCEEVFKVMGENLDEPVGWVRYGV